MISTWGEAGGGMKNDNGYHPNAKSSIMLPSQGLGFGVRKIKSQDLTEETMMKEN